MPGEKSTSQDKTVKAHSSLVSLDGADDVEGIGTGTAEDPTQMKTELDELRKQNERYKQQMAGWETQSKRNLTERDQLADRVARMEGHISATANGKTADKTSEKALPSGKLKSALQKWLDNDDSELNEVEAYLANAAAPRNPAKEEDVENIVTRTLQKFGAKSTLQSRIGVIHPEMGDTNSELYHAVFENYEEYANDPQNKMFFPDDDQFLVPVPDPAGGKAKMMDARIVRQLASELKVQSGITEGRRQGQESRSATYGAAQTGNGRTTSTARNRSVEALELLTQNERNEMANLKSLKAWPKEWPTDDKAAAKMIFDNLSAPEKSRRLTEYRRVRN